MLHKCNFSSELLYEMDLVIILKFYYLCLGYRIFKWQGGFEIHHLYMNFGDIFYLGTLEICYKILWYAVNKNRMTHCLLRRYRFHFVLQFIWAQICKNFELFDLFMHFMVNLHPATYHTRYFIRDFSIIPWFYDFSSNIW